MLKKSSAFHLSMTLALATSLLAVPASADDTNQSTANLNASSSSILNKIALSYWGNYSGPTFSGFNGNTVNAQWDPWGNSSFNAGPQSVRSYFTSGYRLSNDVTVGPAIRVEYQPVMGQDLTIDQTYLRIGDSHLYHSGNFNISADARVYLPLNSVQQQQNFATGVGSFQVTTYEIPKTRLTLGLYTYEFYGIYTTGYEGDGVENRQDQLYYAGPYLSYQVTPKFSLIALYELNAQHTVGQGFDLSNAGTDFEPGFEWEITPNISVNPYVNFFTGDSMTSANTFVGMILSAKIL